MANEVTNTRTAYIQAQQREKALRDELSGLEYALVEARGAEEQAAIVALDGGSEKTVAKATAKVRELEDSVRVKQLQLSKLVERTEAARVALDEALSIERQEAQEADFKLLQDDMSAVYEALSVLDDALRVVKGRVVSISQRYRAAGGRDHNGQRFYECLRQVVVNQISEVDLLERGGSPDVLKVIAPMISGMPFLSVRGVA